MKNLQITFESRSQKRSITATQTPFYSKISITNQDIFNKAEEVECHFVLSTDELITLTAFLQSILQARQLEQQQQNGTKQ